MENKTSDHDTLIRLETKVDDLKVDIKDLKDGTTEKIAEHEARLKTIEAVHLKIDPVNAVRRSEEVIQQMHDFKTTWKVILGLVIGGSSIITFILTTILRLTKIFGG